MADNMEHWKGLLPFVKRTRGMINGREKMSQMAKRLAFILVSEDISKNSRDEALSFGCPVYQTLTMKEMEDLLGFKGTKMVGFLKSQLATAIQNELLQFKINV